MKCEIHNEDLETDAVFGDKFCPSCDDEDVPSMMIAITILFGPVLFIAATYFSLAALCA